MVAGFGRFALRLGDLSWQVVTLLQSLPPGLATIPVAWPNDMTRAEARESHFCRPWLSASDSVGFVSDDLTGQLVYVFAF